MPYSQQVYYGQTINNLTATKQLNNAAGGTFTGGTLTGWATGSPLGATVIFTSNEVAKNVTDLLPVTNGTAVDVSTREAAGIVEKAEVSFRPLATTQVLTLGGYSFTAGANGATANQLASAFASISSTSTLASLNGLVNAAVGQFTALGSGWTSSAATGATVTFTSTTLKTDVSNLAAEGNGAASAAIVTTPGALVDSSESATVNFKTLAAGKTISEAGLTYTAGTLCATAEQVAFAFSYIPINGATAVYANSAPLLFASQYVVTPGALTNATSLSGYITKQDDGNAYTFIATGAFTVTSSSADNTTIAAIKGTVTGLRTFTNGALTESITYGASVDTTLFGVTNTPSLVPVSNTVLNNQRAQASLQYNNNLSLLNSGATFIGSDGSIGGVDQVQGGSSKDFFTGNTGNDYFDGKAGLDTAIYRGQKADYIIGSTTTLDRTDPLALNQVRAHLVTDLIGLIGGQAGRDGSDTLVNVERLQFADTKVALDLAPTQSAGQTALLIGAVLPGQLAFDVTKQALLGSVIGLFDQNFTLAQLSGAILRLPIWDVLTGNEAPTTADIATYLVNNVYGGTAPTAITNAAITAMSSESRASQGNYLASLAVSTANQTHINLVGIQSTGLEYVG